MQRTHKEAAGQVETLTSSSERKGLRVGRELKTQGERIIRQRLMAEAWEREITRVVDLIGKSFKEGMDGRKATREELQRDLRPDMVSLKDKLKKLAGITRDLALQMVFPTEMREDGLSPFPEEEFLVMTQSYDKQITLFRETHILSLQLLGKVQALAKRPSPGRRAEVRSEGKERGSETFSLKDAFSNYSGTIRSDLEQGMLAQLTVLLTTALAQDQLRLEFTDFGTALAWLIENFPLRKGTPEEHVHLVDETRYEKVSELLAMADVINDLNLESDLKGVLLLLLLPFISEKPEIAEKIVRDRFAQLELQILLKVEQALKARADISGKVKAREIEQMGDMRLMGEEAIRLAKGQGWYEEGQSFARHHIAQGYGVTAHRLEGVPQILNGIIEEKKTAVSKKLEGTGKPDSSRAEVRRMERRISGGNAWVGGSTSQEVQSNLLLQRGKPENPSPSIALVTSSHFSSFRLKPEHPKVKKQKEYTSRDEDEQMKPLLAEEVPSQKRRGIHGDQIDDHLRRILTLLWRKLKHMLNNKSNIHIRQHLNKARRAEVRSKEGNNQPRVGYKILRKKTRTFAEVNWGRVDPRLVNILQESLFMAVIAVKDAGVDLQNLILTAKVSRSNKPISSGMNKEIFIQVLTNLFNNALHAMKESERKELTIETGRQGERDFIRISDTGHGIAPEDLPNIWRLDFSKKPLGIKGTGEGLGIVKKNVEGYDGQIKVDSTLGQGTSFTIFMSLGHLTADRLEGESDPQGVNYRSEVRVALQILGGIFSRDFIKRFGIPDAVAREAPEAGAWQEALVEAERAVSGRSIFAAKGTVPSAGEKQGTVPFATGIPSTADAKRAMIVKAAAFEKWGPLFGLLKKQYGDSFQVAVVTEGESEERDVQRETVEKLNRALKLGAFRLLAYDSRKQAEFALLRKGIPEAQIQFIGFGSHPLKPPAEFNELLSLPADQALLAQFSAEFRSLESAA